MKVKLVKKAKILNIKKSALKNMDERGFGAILEDLSDKFSIMIEGLSMVNQKFDTFKIEITERIDSLEETMRSNFKTVFDYLSRMDEDIQQIKSDFANLKVSKADETEVAQMKIRIANLEYELAQVRRIAERKV